jgi:hypothetical protein
MNPNDPNAQYPPPPSAAPGGYPPPDAAYPYEESYVGMPMLHPEHLTDGVKHQQENRSGAASLAIAALVHVGLFALLALVVVSQIQDPPPEFIVAATQGVDDPKINKQEFANSPKQKPAAPSAKPSALVTANVSSPVAVPSLDIPTDTPSLGNSFGDGFGSGGLGDGFGGGGMGIPAAMKGRCDAADRAKRLRESGGEAKMDRAVVQALRWLKGKQNEDGSWSATYPAAMTGLCLLAFCGHCETVDSPEFGVTVAKAIAYLVEKGDSTGGMMVSVNGNTTSYEHAICVYALAEAYSLNKNARKPFAKISPVLKDAVPIIIDGQTGQGGWLYGYNTSGDGDLSVSGWNVQALKAAELTGLHFSAIGAAKKKASKYLEEAATEDGNYKYRLANPDGKESLIGVGLLCSRMLGEVGKFEDKGIETILAKKPAEGAKGMDAYAWYYYSQACFQRGGTAWRDYNKSYQQVVMNTQNEDGSWNAPGTHTGGLGNDVPIYSTALCTLMMEVYYRYLPATDTKKSGRSSGLMER